MRLQIEVLCNGGRIRQDFMEKYLDHYESDLMWNKIPSKYPSVSFADALALLRGLSGDVLFMSEGPACTWAHPLQYQGQRHLHFVAKTDAIALADLIEFEWMEDARLLEQGRYLATHILPADLYVFTPGMDRVLVFTHETDAYEAELAEDYIKQAESRVCIACGFDQKV